jgi:hypothetical protein
LKVRIGDRDGIRNSTFGLIYTKDLPNRFRTYLIIPELQLDHVGAALARSWCSFTS